jgi:hypothetical protein
MISPKQTDILSKLTIDIGKILFAAAVVGFFIPGFSGDVSFSVFIVSIFSSLFLFITGINLSA